MIAQIKFPKIFRNKEFLRLWGNQLILQISFNMCNYTALLILANRTHSPFVQAQFYAALTLPAFIFGFFAGPVVDMVDKKRVMLVANFLLAILFLSYAFFNSTAIAIMLIAFLTSSVARFFIPAEAATIPYIVSEESLEHANTFFIFTLLGSVLVGYAIAGPIVEAFGGLGTKGELAPFIIGGFILFLGLIPLLTLKKIPFFKPDVSRGTLLKRTFKLFRETLREVKKNRNISVPIGLLVFVEFVIGSLSILLLEYVARYLTLPLPSISYVLMLPLIVGLIFGVILLPRIEKRYGRINSILASCFLIGLMFILLGAAPIVSSVTIIRMLAVVGAFLMGIAVVVISVQARTILQLNSRDEMQGRIFSFLDIMIAFVIPVPVLILGFLADKVSILLILSMIGILTIMLVFFSVRRIRRAYAGTPRS